MDIILSLFNAVGVIILAIVGLLRWTKKNNRINIHGWILLILGTLLYTSTTVIEKRDNNKADQELKITITRLEKIMGKYYDLLYAKKYPKEVSLRLPEKPSNQIQIKTPEEGSEVHWKTYVKGIIANTKATVYLIVHPLDVSGYWVQPDVTVSKDGTWKGMVYLGQSGDIDIGKDFEIMAVANPKIKLNEGHVLGVWPRGQWNSQVIQVTRRF